MSSKRPYKILYDQIFKTKPRLDAQFEPEAFLKSYLEYNRSDSRSGITALGTFFFSKRKNDEKVEKNVLTN